MVTATAVASFSQIAALAGVGLNHLRTDLLPPAVLAYSGAPGRPMQVVTLEDLARFIEQRTGHLSEAECRVRLAMTNRCGPRRTGTLPPFRIVVDDQGRHVVVPMYTKDLDRLTELDRLDAERALAHQRTHREQQP